ncbi:Tigger transposable element-derived protein 1-like 118 [Homarus americanus]|uniref:Tigger transposable element-derived protein 1-like 118 n=1 Tax=Homarus americanus TaxID=6706 RepID=A0A8J5N532_HOMAM|nr:Tigger transposable element-derived protein 1-like 118 [Homarus americanus]
MPPKRPAAPSGSTPKRARRVLTLNEKNEVLKQLDSGMSYAAVGRHFGLNESSVRGIKRRAKDLKHALASSAPVTSKVTSHVRDDALIKMEKALNNWIEDLKRRRIPLNSKFIRQKAKELYDKFSKGDDHGVGDEQLVELQDETEDEVSDDENKNLTLDNLGEVIRMSKALSARLYDIDPSLDRSLKAKRAIENVMLPYIELQREMRSKKAQTTITNFFSRRVPAIAEPAGILQQEAEAADTSQQQDVEAAGTSQQQDAVPAHTPQEDADLDSSYSSDWSGF